MINWYNNLILIINLYVSLILFLCQFDLYNVNLFFLNGPNLEQDVVLLVPNLVNYY